MEQALRNLLRACESRLSKSCLDRIKREYLDAWDALEEPDELILDIEDLEFHVERLGRINDQWVYVEVVHKPTRKFGCGCSRSELQAKSDALDELREQMRG